MQNKMQKKVHLISDGNAHFEFFLVVLLLVKPITAHRHNLSTAPKPT